MDDIVNVWMCRKHAIEGGFVGDINLEKLGFLPTDELNAIENLCRRIIEIVYNDNFVVGLQECKGSK